MLTIALRISLQEITIFPLTDNNVGYADNLFITKHSACDLTLFSPQVRILTNCLRTLRITTGKIRGEKSNVWYS